MARYEFNTTPKGNDWDVRGEHTVIRGSDIIVVTHHEPTGIHAWHDSHDRCMCRLLFLPWNCNGVPRGDLTIVSNAPSGTYSLRTSGSGVVGEAGTLHVGSGGLGEGHPHRHR